MAREAVILQQEYEDAVKYSMRIMERERAEKEAKASAAAAHRDAIHSQIEVRHDRRRKEQAEKYEEGRRLRDEFAAERAKLEAIRDHMVSEMERKGVNPKYLTEMKMADIQKMQMR